MMHQKRIMVSMLLGLMLSFVGACGSSSSSSSGAVYTVQYLPGSGMDAPKTGKTSFQIKISKTSDGSAATGLEPKLDFLMQMSATESHGTPVDSVTESATPGLYDCTVYYLMAGTWEMRVTVAGETTTFNPVVAGGMGTGGDTVKSMLFGPSDVMTGMSGTSYDKYYIFRDGSVSASSQTLGLYITHGQNMMMDFIPLTQGAVMSGMSGTVMDMLVTASTASNFVTSVSTTVSDRGHFTLTGLSGLVSGTTNTIYVKLSVNSENKTSDGAAPSGTGANDFATFYVTPGM